MENQNNKIQNTVTKRSPGRPPIYTAEERKKVRRRTKYIYMLNKEWFCDICNTGRDYTLAGKHCHLKTKKHQTNLQNINNQ